MNEPGRAMRCAIYTRKSTEEGLEQDFNSLQAQREAAEAYIRSQRPAGWTAVSEPYDDGGFSGASLERPVLRKLLSAIQAGRTPADMDPRRTADMVRRYANTLVGIKTAHGN